MSTNDHSAEQPETALDPDEPRTPTWFTFLGVALFLLGGVFLLASSDGEEEPPIVPSPEAQEAAPSEDGEANLAAGEAAPDPHAGHGHD